jgi:predicted Zn-dependent protease
MKRAILPLLSLTFAVTLMGAISSVPPVAAPTPVRHIGISAGSIARVLAAVTTTARRGGGDHAETMRRLREGETGTYIGDILAERDSSVARWADRHGKPLSVWVQPASGVNDFEETYVVRVREAFEEWDELHLPVRFAFVNDSADADVHVNWIDHFDKPISGRTRWSRDDDWVITDANIVLALHHQGGDLLDFDAMHAMALHEIGHLLGLDHTQDTLSIMAPKVRVRELSEADRATVRLIYALPAGPVR